MPVYLVGGWYDSWARQTTMSYAALSKQQARADQDDPGAVDSRHAHDVGARRGRFRSRTPRSTASNSVCDGTTAGCRDIDNGVENDAPVKIFVMGGGSEAKTSDGLPSARRRVARRARMAARAHPLHAYYLHGDGSLSRRSLPASRTAARTTISIRAIRSRPSAATFPPARGDHAAGRLGPAMRSARLELPRFACRSPRAAT